MVATSVTNLEDSGTTWTANSGSGPSITVPDAHLLFNADFGRDGADLVLSDDHGQSMRVFDYFSSETKPDLVTADGARLAGDVVEVLAGPAFPAQYAQATPAAGGAQPIGQVETASGAATVQRTDGTVETLAVGTKVFQNDVVQTADGGALSITFSDGTIFTLASASRMVLSELVYDPGGNGNSAVFNLVEGSFVFIAGQVAKTGGMEVNTPVATMGIRGTTVRVEIGSTNGETTVEVSLNRDPDGSLGEITLTDLSGNLIANITSTDSKWFVSPVDGQTQEIQRTANDLASDQAILNDAARAFQSAQQRVQAGEQFVNQGDGANQDGNDDNQQPDGQEPDNNDDAAPGEAEPGEDAPQRDDDQRGDLGGGGTETALATDTITSIAAGGDARTGDLGASSTVSIDPLGTTTPPGTPPPPPADTPPVIVVENQTTDPVIPTDTGLQITLPTLTENVAEDGEISLTGFAISNSSGGSLTATLVAGSTVSIDTGTGVEIVSGTGTNDERLVIEGTASQLTAALNSITYRPSPNDDDGGTLDIEVSDGANSTSARLVIGIDPEQDAPEARDDAVDTVANGGSLSGSVTENDSDPDTGDTLTVASASEPDGSGGSTANPVPLGQPYTLRGGGKITLNEDSSFTFEAGNAYDRLEAGEVEVETVVYEITDGQVAATASLNITVTGTNDAPTLSGTLSSSVAEGGSVGLTAANLSGVDVDDAPAGLTYSVISSPSNGQVELAGAPGTAVSTFTQAQINADEIIYVHNGGETTSDSFTFSLADGGEDGAQPVAGTFSVNVTPVNDAPTGSGAPTVADFQESTPAGLDLSGLVLSDPDSADNVVRLDLNSNSGELSATGTLLVTVTGGGTSLSLEGSIDNLSAFLQDTDAVTYTPEDGILGDDADSVSLTINDLGNSGAGGPLSGSAGSIAINIADINFPPDVSTTDFDPVPEGSPGSTPVVLNLADNVDVSDPDVGDEPFIVDTSINVVAAAGQSNAFDSAFSTDGTLIAVDVALFDALAAGEEIFYDVQFDVSSGSDVVASSLSLTVTGTNDGPVIGGDFAISVDEGGLIAITAADLDASDVDDAGDGLTYSLVDGGNNGQLELSDDPGFAIGSFTQADINAGRVFYRHDGSETLSDLLDIQVADGGEDGAAPDNASISVTVSAVNDAPILSGDLTAVVDEGEVYVLTTDDLSGVDVDNAPSELVFNITVGPGNGQLESSGSSGGGVSSFTLAQLNAGEIVYVHDGGELPTDSFDFELTDGETPTAGSFNIDVAPVNDDPTANGLPFDVVVDEDIASAVDLSAINLSDVDAAGGSLLLTLEAGLGTLLASAASGVTVTQVSASIVELEGTVDDLNAYLGGAGSVDYTGVQDANGADADLINVSVSDQGNTGEGGGSAIDLGSIGVDINPVNDEPEGSPAGTLSNGTEDTPYLVNVADLLDGFSDADGDTLSVSSLFASDGDVVDNADGTFTVTPTANFNGEVTLTYDVDDGNGGTLFEETLSYIVDPVNDDPVVDTPIPDDSVDEDASKQITIPVSTFSDPDAGDTLTYTAQRVVGGVPQALPAWITFSAVALAFTITAPANADVGNHTFRVTATDSAGASVFTDFDIEVFNTNDAPTVDQGISDQAIAVAGALNFTIPGDAFDDVDVGDELALTAEIFDGTSTSALPSWLSFDGSSFTGTPPPSAFGSLDIRVTAIDYEGEMAITDFLLTINANVIGSNNDDTLNTTAAADYVTALDGDDIIIGSLGDDIIDGGAGVDDTIDYSFATNTVTVDLDAGTATGSDIGADTLLSIENVSGGSASDDLTGNGLNNELFGNAGDDTIQSGDGTDILTGGAGNDTLIGSTTGLDFRDFDIANYSDSIGGGVTANLTGALGSFSSTVTGNASVGTDTLTNIDMIAGSNFDDTFSVDGTYQGQFDGFNIFEGRGGNDVVLQSNGDTEVSFFDASAGVLVDLAQRNAFSIDAGDTANVGDDSYLYGSNANAIKRVAGSDFDDILRGSNNDRERFRPGGGDDVIDGRGGSRDGVDYGLALGAVNVNLQTGIALDGEGGTDTLISIERARGSSFADTIIGTSGFNVLRGNAGADTLNDSAGSGIVVGGAGDDILIGSSQEFGEVTAAYWSATAGVTMTLMDGSGSTTSTAIGNADTGTDQLINIAGMYGSNFDDTYTVESSYQRDNGVTSTTFVAGLGNDTIFGNGKVGLYFGDAQDAITVNLETGTSFSTNSGDTAKIGADTFSTNGTAARAIERVSGSNYDDTIIGADDLVNEFLEGRAGNDFIDGGINGVASAAYWGAPGSIFADMNVGPATGGSFYVQDGYGTTDTVTNVSEIHGGNGNDTLIAPTAGSSVFFGNDGDDTLTGGALGDSLNGGAGDDIISGNGGDDYIDAGGEGDRVDGGAGNDTIVVGENDNNGSNPEHYGSHGDDTYNLSAVDSDTWASFFYDFGTTTPITQSVTFTLDMANGVGAAVKGTPGVTGYEGTDTYTNFGNVFGTYFQGSEQGDVFNVTTSTDKFIIVRGASGSDTYDVDASAGGSARLDFRNFGFASQGISLDLSNIATTDVILTDEFGFSDVITMGSDIRGIQGSFGSDVITGSSNAESFILEQSNFGVSGDVGYDVLDGGGGFDRVRYDRNRIDTGVNADFTGENSGGVGYGTVTGSWDGQTFQHHISNVEHVVGSRHDDTIKANDAGMKLEGREGGDFLQGGSGNDTILSGYNGSWNGVGTGTLDTILGSDGDDAIDFIGGSEDSLNRVNYSQLGDGILFTVNGDTATTQKIFSGGIRGTDTFSNFDDVSGVSVLGSNNNDTFVINAATGAGWTVNSGLDSQWLSIAGGGGDDTYTFNTGFIRLNYNNAAAGISFDLTNLATTDVSFNDGQGGSTIDTIKAGSNINEIYGTRFSDTITGSSADERFIGGGNGAVGDTANVDVIDGGAGIDTIRYNQGFYSNINVDLSVTGGFNTTGTANGIVFNEQLSNIENVFGSNTDDTIIGDSGNNRLEGRGGRDILDGGAGNDTIVTGNSSGFTGDTILGSTGNDMIDVSGLTDGGLFLDYSRSAIITGGIDAVFDGDTATIDKGALGTDTVTSLLTVDETYGSTLKATEFDDTVVVDLKNSDEWLEVRLGDGTDSIHVLGGSVRVDYGDSPGTINVDLAAGIVTDGFGNTDILTGDIWEVRGTNVVTGGTFDDVFVGSAANESFTGQAGNDSFDGGLGFDRLRYDSGNVPDSVSVDLATGSATANYVSTTYTDTFTGIEWVRGSFGNDFIQGSLNADRIQGRDGDDTLGGEGGFDRVEGEGGDDSIYLIQQDFVNGLTELGLNYVDGGSGQDELDVVFGNMTLDLTGADGGKVRNFESIDLSLGDNPGATLIVDETAIAGLSGEANTAIAGALGTSGLDSILVKGDANDLLEFLDGGSQTGASWQLTTTSSINSQNYDIYEYAFGSNTFATLAVDDDVQVIGV